MGRIDFRAGGIWTAVHTPFGPGGELDEDGIARNIDYYADGLAVAGVFFNGLFGEHWALTFEERQRATAAAARAARGRIALTPNCTHHSLAETIALARHAEAAGCAAVALMNPAAGPRGEAELREWFCRVADAVQIDLIIFNTPAPGYTLSAELVARLAASGRFAVLKAAGGSHEVSEARRLAGERLVVSDPSEGSWLGNLLAHDQQLLYADPEPYLFQTPGDRPLARLLEAYRSGNLAEAASIHRALGPVRRVYEEWIIGPLRRGRPSAAATKHWAAKRGLAAGPVRPPLAPLSAVEIERLDRALAAAADLA